MDRRAIISSVICGLVIVPVAAMAQTATRVRHIGFLSSGPQQSQADFKEEDAALRAVGWVEGQNLVVERRYANGQSHLLRSLAEELVGLKVEIIVTSGTDATVAAKNATSTIPIVFLSAGDPVRSGLVASLSRPGGNITGTSRVGPEIDAKRLALLLELMPAVQRIGVLENSNNPYHRAARNEFERACGSVALQPIFIEVAAAGELENAIAEMARRRVQVVFLAGDSLFFANLAPIMKAALRYALPIFATNTEMMEAGALVSYSGSGAQEIHRYAAFVDRILRGAKPADLPIEQPTRFELGINLKTAKALGLTIPQSLLLRADEVIQ